MAGALDGKSPAGRRHPGGPSSRANRLHPVHSARYYTRWRAATRESLDLNLLELMPPLAALCPPATVIDKTRYSGFAEPRLPRICESGKRTP